MTTKKIWVLPLLLNFFVLASCSFSKLDGDWDAMEWKEEVEVQKINGAYMVPPSGTSLSFTCRNYSGIQAVGEKVLGKVRVISAK